MRAQPSSADHGFEAGPAHPLPTRRADGEDLPRAIVLQAAAPRAVEWTAAQLVAGGVVALPTDTVYGIAAALANQDALHRLFAIKGRPADRTIPVLVSSTDALARLALDLGDRAVLLLDRYWPGPLTVVIPARHGMPAAVMGPGGTVGVRLPNHPLAIEVIEKAGGAIACTSANRHGAAPARSAAEVAETLGPELDLILDGGGTPGGVPSTVVALDGDDLRVLRDGAIPWEHLLATWSAMAGGAQSE